MLEGMFAQGTMRGPVLHAQVGVGAGHPYHKLDKELGEDEMVAWESYLATNPEGKGSMAGTSTQYFPLTLTGAGEVVIPGTEALIGTVNVSKLPSWEDEYEDEGYGDDTEGDDATFLSATEGPIVIKVGEYILSIKKA